MLPHTEHSANIAASEGKKVRVNASGKYNTSYARQQVSQADLASLLPAPAGYGAQKSEYAELAKKPTGYQRFSAPSSHSLKASSTDIPGKHPKNSQQMSSTSAHPLQRSRAKDEVVNVEKTEINEVLHQNIESTRAWVDRLKSLAQYTQDSRTSYGLPQSEASETIWRKWHEIKLLLDSQRKHLLREVAISKRRRRKRKQLKINQKTSLDHEFTPNSSLTISKRSSDKSTAIIVSSEQNDPEYTSEFAKLGKSVAKSAKSRELQKISSHQEQGDRKSNSDPYGKTTAAIHLSMIPFLHAIKSAWNYSKKLRSKSSKSQSYAKAMSQKSEKLELDESGDENGTSNLQDNRTNGGDSSELSESDSVVEGDEEDYYEEGEANEEDAYVLDSSESDKSDKEQDEEDEGDSDVESDGGLSCKQFVAFISGLLNAPAEEVEVLFRKIDANDDGDLSWYEYLSYLYREIAYRRHLRTAHGSYTLWEDDRPPMRVDRHTGAAHVKSIFVVPSFATPNIVRGDSSRTLGSSSNRLPHYLFATKDNHIHVWSGSMPRSVDDSNNPRISTEIADREDLNMRDQKEDKDDCFEGYIEPTWGSCDQNESLQMMSRNPTYVHGSLSYQSTFPLAGLGKVTAPHAARLGSFVSPLTCDHTASKISHQQGSQYGDIGLQSVKSMLPEGVASASSSSAARGMLSSIYTHMKHGQFEEMPADLAAEAKLTAEELMDEPGDDRALDDDQKFRSPIPGVMRPRFTKNPTNFVDSSTVYRPASPKAVPYQVAADSQEIPIYEDVDGVKALIAVTTPSAISASTDIMFGDRTGRGGVRFLSTSKHRLSAQPHSSSNSTSIPQSSRTSMQRNTKKMYQNLRHGTRIAAEAAAAASRNRHHGLQSQANVIDYDESLTPRSSLKAGGAASLYSSSTAGFRGISDSAYIGPGVNDSQESNTVRRSLYTSQDQDNFDGRGSLVSSGRNEMLSDVRKLESELLVDEDLGSKVTLTDVNRSNHFQDISRFEGNTVSASKLQKKKQSSAGTSSKSAAFATGRPTGLPHNSMCISTKRKQVVLAGSERLMYFFSSDSRHQYRLTDFFMTHVEAVSMTCVEDALLCGDSQGRVYIYNLRGRPCGVAGQNVSSRGIMGGRVGRALASPIYESDSNLTFSENYDESESFQMLNGDRNSSQNFGGAAPLNTSLAPNPVAHLHLHSGRQIKKLEYASHMGIVSAGMDGRIGISSIHNIGQNVRYLGRLVTGVEEATHPNPILNESINSKKALGAGNGAAGDFIKSKLNAYNDGASKILLGQDDSEDIGWVGKSHAKGVTTFAVTSNFIASAGPDSAILIWDPYVKESVGSLNVRCGKIIEIIVNEPYNQLIVVFDDKKIRVFDMRTFQCIQTISDAHPYVPRNNITAAAFDHESQRLITAAGNARFRLWSVGPAGTRSKMNAEAHEASVVFLGHAPAFNQLISVASDGSVRLWDIETGKAVFEFSALSNNSSRGVTSEGSSGGNGGDSNSSGNGVGLDSSIVTSTRGSVNRLLSLSSACFDLKRRRLITSSSIGQNCMWNFNNGGLLHEFPIVARREFGSIHFLGRGTHPLVGLAWDAPMVRWPDPSLSLAIAKPVIQEVVPRPTYVQDQLRSKSHKDNYSSHIKSSDHNESKNGRSDKISYRKATLERVDSSTNGAKALAKESSAPPQHRRHERLAHALAKAQAPGLDLDTASSPMSTELLSGLSGSDEASTTTLSERDVASVQIRAVPPGLGPEGFGELLCVDSRTATMITGTSLGYVLVWNANSLHLSSRVVVPISPGAYFESEAENIVKQDFIRDSFTCSLDMYTSEEDRLLTSQIFGDEGAVTTNEFSCTQKLIAIYRSILSQKLNHSLSEAASRQSRRSSATSVNVRIAVEAVTQSLASDESRKLGQKAGSMESGLELDVQAKGAEGTSKVRSTLPSAPDTTFNGSIDNQSFQKNYTKANTLPDSKAHILTSAPKKSYFEATVKKAPPAVTAVKFIQFVDPSSHSSLSPLFRAAGIDVNGEPIDQPRDQISTNHMISNPENPGGMNNNASGHRAIVSQTLVFVGTETGDIHIYTQHAGALTHLCSHFSVMKSAITSFSFLSSFGNVPDPLLEPLTSNIADALYSAYAAPLQSILQDKRDAERSAQCIDSSKGSALSSQVHGELDGANKSATTAIEMSLLEGSSLGASRLSISKYGDKSTTGGLIQNSTESDNNEQRSSKDFGKRGVDGTVQRNSIARIPTSLLETKPIWGPRKTHMIVLDGTEARIFELPKLSTPAELQLRLSDALGSIALSQYLYAPHYNAARIGSSVPILPQDLSMKLVREFTPHIPYSSINALVQRQLQLQSSFKQHIQELAQSQLDHYQEQQKAIRQLEGKPGVPVVRPYVLQQQMQAEAESKLKEKKLALLNAPNLHDIQQKLLFDSDRLKILQSQRDSFESSQSAPFRSSSGSAHITYPHRIGPVSLNPFQSLESLECEIKKLKEIIMSSIASNSEQASAVIAEIESLIEEYVSGLGEQGIDSSSEEKILYTEMQNLQSQELQQLLKQQAAEIQQFQQQGKYRRSSSISIYNAANSGDLAGLRIQHRTQLEGLISKQQQQMDRFEKSVRLQFETLKKRYDFISSIMAKLTPNLFQMAYSSVSPSSVNEKSILRKLEPGRITSSTSIVSLQAFVTGSDSGDVKMWTRTGLFVSEFGVKASTQNIQIIRDHEERVRSIPNYMPLYMQSNPTLLACPIFKETKKPPSSFDSSEKTFISEVPEDENTSESTSFSQVRAMIDVEEDLNILWEKDQNYMNQRDEGYENSEDDNLGEAWREQQRKETRALNSGYENDKATTASLSRIMDPIPQLVIKMPRRISALRDEVIGGSSLPVKASANRTQKSSKQQVSGSARQLSEALKSMTYSSNQNM